MELRTWGQFLTLVPVRGRQTVHTPLPKQAKYRRDARVYKAYVN